MAVSVCTHTRQSTPNCQNASVKYQVYFKTIEFKMFLTKSRFICACIKLVYIARKCLFRLSDVSCAVELLSIVSLCSRCIRLCERSRRRLSISPISQIDGARSIKGISCRQTRNRALIKIKNIPIRLNRRWFFNLRIVFN